MKIRAGSCRIVFLMDEWVLKIPNFINGWSGIIWGIQENLHERAWFTAGGIRPFKTKEEWPHQYLARIKWADCFGFFVVMERADSLEHYSELWNTDLETKSDNCQWWGMKKLREFDDHDGNIGVTRDKRVVIIDYGYHARHNYIGDPVMFKDRGRTKMTLSYILFFRPIRYLRDKLWYILDKLKIID